MQFGNYLRLSRVKQWTKQVLVFLPLLSLGKSMSLGSAIHVALGAFGFSLVASFVYVLNDIQDKETDAKDNSKKNRPIANQAIRIRNALIFGLAILILGLLLLIASSEHRIRLLFITGLYLLINLIYSTFSLKQNRVIGISMVAIGFPIRFLLGTVILNLPTSYWALALLMLLALAMLSGKRYQTIKRKSGNDELINSQNEKEFWLLSLVIFCAMFGAAYAGFISASETQIIWGKTYLLLSTIPVALALVRYLEIVTHPENFMDQDATEGVVRDFPTLLIGLSYICVMLIGRVTSG